MGETRKAWPVDLHFFQSSIMRKISELSYPVNAEECEKFMQGLVDVINGRRRYVDVLHERIGLSDKEIAHFKIDWFPDQGQAKWFPLEHGQELERKLSQAMLAAFQRAKETGKPLEYYWSIPIKCHQVQFDIMTNIIESPQQVTLLRITPAPRKEEEE